MAIDALLKSCAKNVAGNYRNVFFGNVNDVTTITVSSTPFEITAMTSTAKFQIHQAEMDSVDFKVEGKGGQSFFTTQTLTVKFAKLTKELIAAIDNLIAAAPCGILAILGDNNGVAWLAGYDGQAVDKVSRPFNKIDVKYESGMKPSDEAGNVVTVTLTRESEYFPTPFDATLSGQIFGGTAGFIAIT